MAVEHVADRASAYDMPGEIVDGNDVVAVRKSVTEAIGRARNGEGPSLVECKSFRMTGHSAHDNASYVPTELFEDWEKRDPIQRFEAFLTEQGVLDAEDIGQLSDRVIGEIDEAVALAEQDPYPNPEDCLTNVYYEG